LRTSPVVQGEDGYTPAGDFGAGFDVDPNLDPELALALRVSMEEQRLRQEEDSKKEGGTAMDTTSVDSSAAPVATSNEDAMLMNAMYSMNAAAGGGASTGGGEGDAGSMDYAAMTEDEQIALAIQMSMSDANPESTTSELKESKSEGQASSMETDVAANSEPMEEDQDYSAVMSDPAFLTHLVGSLPGVDPNSEAIQNALQALTGVQDSNQDDKEKANKDKKDETK